jgi:hypothetical protein
MPTKHRYLSHWHCTVQLAVKPGCPTITAYAVTHCSESRDACGVILFLRRTNFLTHVGLSLSQPP